MAASEILNSQLINLCMRVRVNQEDGKDVVNRNPLVIRESKHQRFSGFPCESSAIPMYPPLCYPSVWQPAHEGIREGSYFIRNRQTNGQLTVWDWVDVPRAVLQVWPFDSVQRVERMWEIRRDDTTPGGLTIVSHLRPGSTRYMHNGPHVFEEKNLVRMFPVPGDAGWFYISPTMSHPPSVIMDPNLKGSASRPVTMMTLRRLDDDKHSAQWQLVPTSL